MNNDSNIKEELKGNEITGQELNAEPINEEAIRAKLLEELEADKQREIDKRVTEAIKKREAKFKAEQVEKERLSKLSEEEKIKELQADKERELNIRHRELVTKELKLELVDILSENSLPLEFRDVIDISKYVDYKAEDRVDSLKKDVNLFKNTFDSIIDKRVEEIKKDYLKGTSPVAVNSTNKSVSEYDKAKSSSDVKAMLRAKLEGKI